ncbi:MAG: porin [Pirellulaceae bacterium]|nr:porin [Pirellulaceae bacterium]
MRRTPLLTTLALACWVLVNPAPWLAAQTRLPPVVPLPAAPPRVEASDWTEVSLAAHRTSDPDQPVASDIQQRLMWLEDNQSRLQRLLDEQDPQAGPGANYRSEGDLFNGDPLPNYAYFREYYDRFGPGARPLADYAPPGYEPRDQQQGPAVPEFTRVSPPPQLTSRQLDQFVTRGLYPGSFLVPGVNTSVRLRGFVRLAALYDFDPIGVPDAFVTNSIPVPQQIGQNFNMSGRISRFALETWTPTTFADWNVHTFIEADFFNGPGQAAGGGGNPLRLRHAFLDFGYFRFGQQNTVFMDASSWPSLVDFQGPNSWVNQRQPSARVTLPLWPSWYWAASVERPFSDITTRNRGNGVQDVPDFATHLRYEAHRGHLQLSGLWRTIGYRPSGGELTRETGGAISGSVVLHPWAILTGTDPVCDPHPSGWTRSRLLFQASGGTGIGRYLNDLAGQGLDGQVDPLTGQFELLDASGWNASYEHWFNDYWLANFTYASVSVDSLANQPGSTYDNASYWAASLWWIPVTRLSFAVELLSGERQNVNGLEASVQRLHGLAQYNF